MLKHCSCASACPHTNQQDIEKTHAHTQTQTSAHTHKNTRAHLSGAEMRQLRQHRPQCTVQPARGILWEVVQVSEGPQADHELVGWHQAPGGTQAGLYRVCDRVHMCLYIYLGLARTIYIRCINGVYTIFLAGDSPSIRSYIVCIYGSGQPDICFMPFFTKTRLGRQGEIEQVVMLT